MSVSDILKEEGLDNVSLRLEKHEFDRVSELPVPFIAYSDKKEEFVAIQEAENGHVKYYSGKSGRSLKMHWNQFNNEWSGAALIAFPKLQNADSRFKCNSRAHRKFSEKIQLGMGNPLGFKACRSTRR
jgi:ABC-type bacteriocin/lantibiotic exporter with double-glycine peptidase domain